MGKWFRVNNGLFCWFRQTSDPRNGFATVEKEPVGSLTLPMVGDKKVSKFLR